METRFAGSARLGERRRRRLAVEADGTPPATDEIVELASVATSRRVDHNGSADNAVSPNTALPLARLIPVAWWKYVLGGFAGLSAVAGTIAAGWYAPLWTAANGVRFDRLFSTGSSPAADWLAGLLLTTAAQLSLIIWWGRSRSLKDFDGRYRVWTWAAAAWLLLSCCAATGAHRLLGHLAVSHLPGRVPHKDICGWLLPALAIAARLLPALRREMNGCRASRWLLYTAGASYAAAVALEFDVLEALLNGRMGELVQQSAVQAGHLGLMLCMWVHARHVLHATADPGPASRRRLRIPRPHFRLPVLRFRSGVAVADEVSAVPLERKKRRGKRKSATAEPATLQDEAAPEAVVAAKKPIESREPTTHDVADQHAQREQHDEQPGETDEPCWQDRSQQLSEPTDEDSGDANTESFEKPNLKGLSKKQRRRLIQELRDRERANRGS